LPRSSPAILRQAVLGWICGRSESAGVLFLSALPRESRQFPRGGAENAEKANTGEPPVPPFERTRRIHPPPCVRVTPVTAARYAA